MKKLTSILISVIILLGFSFCSTTKSNIKDTAANNHPFRVTKATYNTWVGGIPGSKGVHISISIDKPEINLDSVFFRNMKTALKQEINIEQTVFIGVFTTLKMKHDYNLDKDPLKEYGNKAPSVSLNIPFELNKNEAVVSYSYKGKTYYYKIEKLVKIRPILYPSKNKY